MSKKKPDAAERHRIVCYLSYLARILGVQDYDILLATDYEKDHLATTMVAYGRRMAIITVNEAWCTYSVTQKTHTLLHEMLHIPTDALMREALLPKGNRKRLREAHEQMVDRLAITYRDLVTPFPGSAPTQSSRVHDGGMG